MVVATPRLAPPAPAGGTPDRTDPRAPRVLLAAVAAAVFYACFAGGGITLAHDRWVVTLGAVTALAALAAVLFGQGLSLRASRRGLLGVAGLFGFAAWSAISIHWSVAPDNSWAEANRSLGFAFVAFAAVVIGSSLPRAAERTGEALAGVTLLVALYALAGKTIPGVHLGSLINFDQTADLSRLRQPIGYWNALAIVCVSGAAPLLRMAADPRRTAGRRLGALTGVYVMVLTTMLTYSRGGVVVMIVAVAVLVAAGTERFRTVVLFVSAGLAAAIPLAYALSTNALTFNGLPVSVREKDSAIMLAITVAAGVLLLGWGRFVLKLERDPRCTPARARVVGRRLLIVAGAAVALTAVVLIATGDASTQIHNFKTTRRTTVATDPGRLLSTDSGNRWAWWRESAGAWSDRPLKGWGADSFQVAQRLYRTTDPPIAQPHSVPLQWLAENGLIGFGLAAGGLLALLAAAIARVRRLPKGPAVRGSSAALLAVAVAWMVQSFFEWTWNIPAATMPMLVCLGVLAARPTGEPPRRIAGRLPLLGGAAVAAALVIVSVTLPAVAASKAQDAVLAASQADATPGELARAADQAAYAARLNPLSVDPLKNAALIADRRQQRDAALADLVKAVRRQPYDVESWIALLQEEVHRGDRQGAVRAARKVLELDPATRGAVDLATSALQNETYPNESATAIGSPLVTEVPVP